MTRAEALLDRAQALAALDSRRPQQVNLQGAISSAYYALFNLLVEAAVTSTLGPDRTADAPNLRHAMARWFTHGQMKTVATWFSRSGRIPQEVNDLLGYSPATRTGIVPPELARVAKAFADLQEARHRADYDHGALFTRTEARAFVELARQAFMDWQQVRDSTVARMFLLLLLTGSSYLRPR